ncbi:hypothetical protein QQF64_025547 [Cirrhinus molitorella]|uniref:Uncharacterized protein n=1 Tax=Cirrhinus molitorella TaxID=172907 RepID=A0ABR3NPN7_9TELE
MQLCKKSLLPVRQGHSVSWDASQGERIKIKTSNRCANPETGSAILIHGCFLSGHYNSMVCLRQRSIHNTLRQIRWPMSLTTEWTLSGQERRPDT